MALDLRKIVAGYASSRNIHLTSFALERIRNIERQAKELGVDGILKKLNDTEEELRLGLKKEDWQKMKKELEAIMR